MKHITLIQFFILTIKQSTKVLVTRDKGEVWDLDLTDELQEKINEAIEKKLKEILESLE